MPEMPALVGASWSYGMHKVMKSASKGRRTCLIVLLARDVKENMFVMPMMVLKDGAVLGVVKYIGEVLPVSQ